MQRNVQIRESLDNTYVDDRFKWVKNIHHCMQLRFIKNLDFIRLLR